MKQIKFITLAIAIMTMTSCMKIFPDTVLLAGYDETQKYEVPDYNAIEVHNNINVVICDTVDSLTITSDASMVNHLNVVLIDSALVLRFRDVIASDNCVTRVLIPAKQHLKEISLSGTSTLEVQSPINEQALDVYLSGCSMLKANINANELTAKISGESKLNSTLNNGNTSIQLSGASEANINGKVKNLTVGISGASDIECKKSNGSYTLMAETVYGSLSGSSHMRVHCDGIIDCSLSGSSTIYYTGDANTQNCSTSASANIQHE